MEMSLRWGKVGEGRPAANLSFMKIKENIQLFSSKNIAEKIQQKTICSYKSYVKLNVG